MSLGFPNRGTLLKPGVSGFENVKQGLRVHVYVVTVKNVKKCLEF